MNMSNDKLFEFLRSKLFDQGAGNDGLPIPPDHVFDNAMIELSAIQAKRRKSRRRKSLLIITAMVAVGSLTTMGFYLNSLNQKIESLEVLVNEGDDQAGLDEESLIPNNDQNSQAASDGSIQEERAPVAARQPKNEISQTSVEGNTASVPLSQKRIAAHVQSENGVSTEQIHVNQGAILPHQAADHVSIGHGPYEVRSISSLSPLIVEHGERAFQNRTESDLNTGIAQTGNWYLGLAGIANASSLSMSGIPASAPMLTGYDDFYWGGGLELSVEYVFARRWSVVGAASFSRVTNQSNLIDRHMYDESNEGMDANGNPMYGAEVLLESPFGPHRGNLEFYTAGYDLTNGSQLDEMVDHRQAMDVWGLSTGVNFRAVTRPKFELILGAGAGATIVSGLHSNVAAEVYYEGSLVTEMLDESDDRQNLNRVSLNGYAAAQGRYFINDHVGVSAGLRYTQSITSLRNASGGQPKTHMTQIMPSVGMIFKLNKTSK